MLDMLPAGRPDEYRATVPGKQPDPGWDFMYLIEAIDACSNGAIYPDLEVETPYVVELLQRQRVFSGPPGVEVAESTFGPQSIPGSKPTGR